MSFKELSLGGSNEQFYRLKDGENRLRIISMPVPVWTSFNRAEGTAKKYVTPEGAAKDPEAKKRFAMWVFDRDDKGAVKLAEFGVSIMKGIKTLANASDTAFDGLPPYDITILRSGSGMETEYTVMAARQNTELTAEEKATIIDLETPLMILRKDAVDGSEVAPF